MATVLAHRAYDDFVDFIAKRVSAEDMLAFKASPAAQKRVETLLDRLKNDEIGADEKAELEQMAHIDLLVGKLKARAAAELKRP